MVQKNRLYRAIKSAKYEGLNMQNYALISLFAPLLSFLFAAIFCLQKKHILVGIISSSFIIISMVSTFILLFYVAHNGTINVYLDDFINLASLNIPYGFMIDEVSVIMMSVITLVGSIVHIYSIGYMEHDDGFNKYFAYLGFFIFSMMFLVMSDNFLGLFIGWEGVGLSSWLLIGFWYENFKFSYAANEAFIMNRIADLGMLLGIFLIYKECGTLIYADVFNMISDVDYKILIFIGSFLFIGSMGKSAQFPFHTWLADAMAGPTPVSALIHAATMVTAGVYLVIRANDIFSVVYELSLFIVYLGTFVAIFAASMAMVQNDLKRIIAYSTLSQLGYMFVATGFGAYWVALFHLVTHAFFKSLLFLCAGNVMHAMRDDLDIRNMGYLYKSMKFTAILMIIASVALSGVYPFAGFFSKDKILEAAFNETNYGIFIALFIGAAMTAFYSFRLIMMVFFTQKRHEHETSETKKFMLFALTPLAFLSMMAGFLEHSFEDFSLRALPEYILNLSSEVSILLIGCTLIMTVTVIIVTIYIYKSGKINTLFTNNIIYKILINEYFIPNLYEKLVRFYGYICNLLAKFDKKVIDFGIDFAASGIYNFGSFASKMQTGNLSLMLRLMVFGLFIILCLAFVI